MKQRVLALAAAMSLILLMAMVVLWVRSRPYYEARFVTSTNRFYVFRSMFGILELDVTEWGQFPPDFSKDFTIYLLPQGMNVTWRPGFRSVFGFGYRNEPFAGLVASGMVVGRTRSWSIPVWVCVGATLILPFIFFYRCVRAYRRRVRMGCSSCGYDLTGNVSGVCPECGATIPTPEKSPNLEYARGGDGGKQW